MRRACFHHKDGSQPSALSESRYSLFALRFSLEDESISLVILSAGAPLLRARVEGPLSLQKTFLCEIQLPSANCQVPTANCQLLTAWLLLCSPSHPSTVCYGDGEQNGFRTLLSQPASKIRADLAGSGWAKVHGILRKSLAPVRIP
jgi:hypothetical protein